MGDKQFIHAMLELFQNTQVKANAKPNAAPNPSNAPASEHGLLTELTFRVAMCEKRLAALEAKQPDARATKKPGVAKRNQEGSTKSNK